MAELLLFIKYDFIILLLWLTYTRKKRFFIKYIKMLIPLGKGKGEGQNRGIYTNYYV